MAYGACAIDGRCPRMDGRAFGFSVAGKGLSEEAEVYLKCAKKEGRR